MPYPIKNTTAQQTNTVRTLNFALGVNQGGYGLTSSTAFWNGRPPSITGYTAYVGNGTSSPTMYILNNDTNVNEFATNLGCGYCTTIQSSLFYILNSGTAICLNVEPPNIVTSGLTLYLDAGFTTSYPKGLTTWYDMSPNLTNGTLTNGPTFDSNYYGSIGFDGVDDYVTCGNPASTQSLTQITMSVWVKFSGLDYVGSTGVLNGFMSKGYPDTLSANTGFWFSYDNRSNGSGFNYTCFGNTSGGFAGGGNNFSSKSYIFENGVWYNITVTVNSSSQGTLYINDVQQGSSVTFSNLSLPNTTNTLYVGKLELGYTLKGSLIQTQLYNRALTSNEVLQNYYAGLQKFIPINSTTLWIDGENTNTRVITPTIAYDIGVDLDNGDLINGLGLSHRDAQTSFSFDGVNDYINLGSPTQLVSTTFNLTVSVWFKITQSQTGGTGGTIIKFGGSAGGWLIGIGGTSLYSYLYTNVGQNLITGISISLNIWHNVTFTFDSGVFILYLDGGIISTTTYGGTITNGGSTIVNVGRDGSTNTNFFNGKITIVRTFNQILDGLAVANLYKAGVPRHGIVLPTNNVFVFTRCCTNDVVYLFSSSSTITVGSYLYTNPGLTVPYYYPSQISLPGNIGCPSSYSNGVSTDSSGLVTSVTLSGTCD
jgi:hypothetical protein